MSSLLIVDDEPQVLTALRRLIQNNGILPVIPDASVTTFASPLHAMQYVADHKVDLVISDYRMPELDGAAFLARVRELQPDCARIIVGAATDLDDLIRTVNQAGILRFVSKPWTDSELKTAVLEVLAYRTLLVENRRLADELRWQRGVISRQRVELDRHEHRVPGLPRGGFAVDGGVMLD